MWRLVINRQLRSMTSGQNVLTPFSSSTSGCRSLAQIQCREVFLAAVRHCTYLLCHVWQIRLQGSQNFLSLIFRYVVGKLDRSPANFALQPCVVAFAALFAPLQLTAISNWVFSCPVPSERLFAGSDLLHAERNGFRTGQLVEPPDYRARNRP